MSDEYCFEIGERVQVYASRDQGTVVSRTVENNPRYGDREACYQVIFADGGRQKFFESQLESPQ